MRFGCGTTLPRFALVVLSIAIFSPGLAIAQKEDGLVLTFSTVGDSRQDPKKPDPSTLPVSGQDQNWLENTKALTRMLRTIEQQKANLLFYDGDMIMGYGAAVVPADTTTVNSIITSDLMQFYKQYGFWRGMVAGTMETGTYVFPVAGNHEVQCNSANTAQCEVSGKHAMVQNENAWRSNMGDLIFDDTRFQNIFGIKPSNEDDGSNSAAFDSLTSSQKQLSYSFDFRNSHFAVINTDPYLKDAHAPVNWLEQDLAGAKARGAQHFFIFGHKPAFTYYFGAGTPLPASPSGLDNDVPSRDAFWNVVAHYGAIYFCGHEHIFHLSQHTSLNGESAWQVLVGSGGSPFEATPTDLTINPATDRDYAWVTVKVYDTGVVKILAYGFDEHFGSTHVIGSLKVNQ
jgi:Calcineurin-like phosphoesterase